MIRRFNRAQCPAFTVALVCTLWLSLSSGAARAHEPPTEPGQRETADVYRELIQRKLAAYNAAFPEIHFVHLEGGELWHGEMVALKAFLGTESAPLDYEHPPHLRPELMEATLARLVHVLRQNVISATAFRLPADNATGRGNLCVVTLNRQHAAASDG